MADGKVLAIERGGQLVFVDTFSATETLYPDVVSFENYHWSPDGLFLSINTKSSGAISISDLLGNAVIEKPTEYCPSTLQCRDVGKASWSPDGALVAIGGREQNIWDVASGEEVRVLPEEGLPIWSPDGTKLGLRANNSKILDATTGAVHQTIEDHIFHSWSPDGRNFATTRSSDIWIWDSQTGEEVTVLVDQAPDVHRNIAWNPTSDCLVTQNYRDGSVSLWGGPSFSKMASLGSFEDPGIMAWDPSGRLLVMAYFEELGASRIGQGELLSGVLVWDNEVMGEVARYTDPNFRRLWSGGAHWHPDGSMFALEVPHDETIWIVPIAGLSIGS